MKKIIYAILIMVALFVLAQFVPYGRDHSNPPVISQPKWDSPATLELVKTACFDCHQILPHAVEIYEEHDPKCAKRKSGAHRRRDR